MAGQKKYAATYTGGKFGKTTVHVVAPSPTPEEIEKILEHNRKVNWIIIKAQAAKGRGEGVLWKEGDCKKVQP